MSFTDIKLLKLYNKRGPKEVLSLKTDDIYGATSKRSIRERPLDAEEKYLRSGMNLQPRNEQVAPM